MDIAGEARKRYPFNHVVDDTSGATGKAQSDPYGYDEYAQRAFIEGARWALLEAATALDAMRPEVGPHIDVNQYRQGRYDALTFARESVQAAASKEA